MAFTFLTKVIPTALILLITLACKAETIEVLAIEYPPFTTSSTPSYGISFIHLNSYAKQRNADLKFKPVFAPPARAEQQFSSKKYCLAFYPPKQDKELFGFQPLSTNKVKLGLVRKRLKGDFIWTDFSQWKGKKVALLRSNLEGSLIENLKSQGVQITFVESITQGLNMLQLGRVDYAFGDQFSLAYYLEHHGIKTNELQLSSTSLLEVNIGFHYRKECIKKIFGPNFPE